MSRDDQETAASMIVVFGGLIILGTIFTLLAEVIGTAWAILAVLAPIVTIAAIYRYRLWKTEED